MREDQQEAVAIRLGDAVALRPRGAAVVLAAVKDARAHRAPSARDFNRGCDELHRVLAGKTVGARPGREPVATRIDEASVLLHPRTGIEAAAVALKLQIRRARRNGSRVLTHAGGEVYGILDAALRYAEMSRPGHTQLLLVEFADASDQLPLGGEALTTSEAAELLGVTHRTVNRMCSSGKLPALCVGGRWLISASDVVKAAEQRRPQHDVQAGAGAA